MLHREENYEYELQNWMMSHVPWSYGSECVESYIKKQTANEGSRRALPASIYTFTRERRRDACAKP
jgi:hypothetical protein